MIKVILWDIDATLLDFLKSESHAIKKAFLHFGLGACSDSKVAEYSKINQSYWQRLELGEITKQQVLIGRFEDFLGNNNINIDAKEFCTCYESLLPECIEFIGNAESIVKTLLADYRQYAVTNGAKTVQRKKLAESGLGEVLCGAFISDEVGYEKPSTRFFDYVIANIEHAEKNEILIVGDSLTSDIKGGNNIGIKTCWFNPHHALLKEDCKVDYMIDNLDSIFDVLKNENN